VEGSSLIQIELGSASLYSIDCVGRAFSHCALAAGETVAFLKTLAALPVSSLTKRFTARRDGIDLRLRTLDNLSRQGAYCRSLAYFSPS